MFVKYTVENYERYFSLRANLNILVKYFLSSFYQIGRQGVTHYTLVFLLRVLNNSHRNFISKESYRKET